MAHVETNNRYFILLFNIVCRQIILESNKVSEDKCRLHPRRCLTGRLELWELCWQGFISPTYWYSGVLLFFQDCCFPNPYLTALKVYQTKTLEICWMVISSGTVSRTKAQLVELDEMSIIGIGNKHYHITNKCHSLKINYPQQWKSHPFWL